MSVVTQFPTTNAAHGTALSSPEKAYSDNADYATAAPAKNSTLASSYETFGFDAVLPAACTITKVQIIYEYYTSTTASNATARVHSTVSGSAQADHNDTSEPATPTVITVNVTADRTWTRANLLDAALTIQLHGIRGNSNNAVTFYFDYVKVEVTYTPLQTITGILVSTGAFTYKKIKRVLTGVQTFTGRVVKKFSHTYTGILSAVGSILGKHATKMIVEGVFTFSGTLIRKVKRILSGILTTDAILNTAKIMKKTLLTNWRRMWDD